MSQGVEWNCGCRGLAERIVSKEVPDTLLDKRLVTLDLPAMIAGSSIEVVRKKLKNVNEVHNAGNVLLFLDELHTIIGAGGAVMRQYIKAASCKKVSCI